MSVEGKCSLPVLGNGCVVKDLLKFSTASCNGGHYYKLWASYQHDWVVGIGSHAGHAYCWCIPFLEQRDWIPFLFHKIMLFCQQMQLEKNECNMHHSAPSLQQLETQISGQKPVSLGTTGSTKRMNVTCLRVPLCYDIWNESRSSGVRVVTHC